MCVIIIIFRIYFDKSFYYLYMLHEEKEQWIRKKKRFSINKKKNFNLFFLSLFFLSQFFSEKKFFSLIKFKAKVIYIPA